MDSEKIERAIRCWIETVVIDLKLCPFAALPLRKNEVRFRVCDATAPDILLKTLESELEFLEQNSEIETTLLIHPAVLLDFQDYNQFLDLADQLILAHGWQGQYQVASFHPDYQFAGTDASDAENFTNRSPYPMLHLLREASLETAIAEYPDTERIPARNIALMTRLGTKTLSRLLDACKNSD